MPISLAITLASASIAATEPPCSWDHPGRNPYRGSIAAAIDRYTDIAPAIASTLKRRMGENQPDDNVIITRDAITGRERYAAQIRAMHFGAASVCSSVSREGWNASRREPAKVYCVGQVCLLVPRICGNISRITRLEAPAQGKAAYYASPGAAKPQEGLAPLQHSPASTVQPAPAPAAPLHTAMRPEAEAASAPDTPRLPLTEAEAPAPVVQADTDATPRNRLPGRTPVIWTGSDDSWRNPGSVGGGGNGGGAGSTNLPSAVPEPSGAFMFAAGLALLALIRRRRQRA
ncbi:MHFG family PEP-CTERM protein [Duganella qianjiadongensis]|uniref:PEP-CTERM sorting domain-containing protein n=1 Tax=Duganella qianjiadongensis TaxID=2692176 RepID=A0ABW9VDY2_9BURK|nr:MHFG family PEP-CTERM protein [Duganella qianjiadongensis]MYM37781.1 PEP-CTERM sorting domain-containing protein [Duganella qianjiadongensis]